MIIRCAGAAIAVTLASAFASFIAGEIEGVAALIGTGAVAIAITNTESEISESMKTKSLHTNLSVKQETVKAFDSTELNVFTM